MTKFQEEILAAILPELQKEVFKVLMSDRRKGVSRESFKRRYKQYETRMSSISGEKLPMVLLIQRLIEANDLMGFSRNLALRKNQFKVNPLTISGEFAGATMDQFEAPMKEVLVPLTKSPLTLPSSQESLRRLQRSDVRGILLPIVFLSIWTALESYLQDRIRARILSSPAMFEAFVGELPVKKLPTQWKDTGRQVIVKDFSERMLQLVLQSLDFSYGNLRKSGNAETVYRQCFGFSLSKFPHIGELTRISKIRNAVVHEGTKWLGISVIQFEYTRLRKFELLVLDFAEWIEQEISKTDGAKTEDRKGDRVTTSPRKRPKG